MRGKPLHNLIARDVQEIARKFFDFTGREYRLSKNGVTTYLDVFARRDSIALAFEVETTVRCGAKNARKAAHVGVPLWIIVPKRRLRSEIARRLGPLGLKPGGEPIKILLLGQLEQELTNYLSIFIPANTENRKE
jgi:hypothetical protein